jgi:Icc-related predicted phosphoesterase
MKVACVSDIHGHLPSIPDCDLLLIGGDLCPSKYNQSDWLKNNFKPWIDSLSERMKIIGVAGNHDFIFQNNPQDVPNMNWTYLQDSGTEFNNFKIWGSPWQPEFHNWAFNAFESDLKKKWNLIPDDADILVLHGPPYKHGDFSPFGRVHTGSYSLLQKIMEIQPKLVIAGHIHSGYGRYEIGNSTFLSCSYVDESYNPFYDIQTIEL